MKKLWSMNPGFRSRIAFGIAALIFSCLTAFGQSAPPMMVQVPYVSLVTGNGTACGGGLPIMGGSTTGSPTGVNYGDGCPLSNVLVSAPWGNAVDAWGNIYFSDQGHKYVRVIYAGAVTVAGVLNPAGAMIAAAYGSRGVTPVAGNVYDAAGGYSAALGGPPYYCTNNGSGTVAGNADGANCPATYSYIGGPYSPVVDSAGNLFIVDKSVKVAYVVIANSNSLGAQLAAIENPVTFPNCATNFPTSCTAGSPQVGYIYKIAAGNAYTDKVLATTAGAISIPYGIAVDASENLYIADYTNNAIRMVNGPNNSTSGGVSPGFVHTIGGYCSAGACTVLSGAPGSGVPALSSTNASSAFLDPEAIVADSYGNVYIGDNSASVTTSPSSVRVIYASGANNPLANLICIENPSISNCSSSLVAGDVYTLAGNLNANTTSGATGNGALATSSAVKFEKIQGLALDSRGNIYLADYSSQGLIAEINATTGLLEFLAGDSPSALAIGNNCASGATAGNGPTMTDIYGDGCPATESKDSHIEGNPAFDAAGNMYFSDSGYNLIRKLTFSGSFPATAVGSPVTQNLAFELLTGTTSQTAGSTGAPIAVLTQGTATNSEFTNAGGTADTCTLSITAGTPTLTGFSTSSTGTTSTSTSNSTCVLPVTFTPAKTGVRSGAVQITATVGGVPQLLATAYVNGVGNGAALAIDPGSFSSVGSGSAPYGVAADSAGNVYYTLDNGNELYSTPGGPFATTPGTGLSNPAQVAVDGAGNLFVADVGNNRIAEFVGGATTPMTAVGNLSAPNGVAVDAAGNLYIADTGNSRILFQPIANGLQKVLASSSTFSMLSPIAVAVDAAGNVYFADSGVGAIIKIPAGGGTPLILAASIQPESLAVDAAGDIVYADNGLKEVVEIPTSGSNAILVSGLSTPSGVALDPSGNLYVADSASTAGVAKYTRTAAAQVLASGTPQVATVTNIGNLNYTGSTSQTDGTDFSIAAVGGTCSTTALFTLDFGTACELSSSLSGSGTDTVSFSGSASTLTLYSAVATTTTLGSVTSTSASPTYGDTITVTISVAPNSGSATPTGTVSFVVDGGLSSAPYTLTNGSYTYTLSTPALPLSAAAHTVAATYTPAASSPFVGSGATLSPSLTVLAKTVTVSPTPITATYGQSAPITIPSIAGATITGLLPQDAGDTANFSTLATTTSPVSASPYAITGSLLTSAGPVDSNYILAVSSSSTVTIQPAALTLVVNNANMLVGQSLPVFTGTLSGYLPADANYIAPVYSTTATSASPVGQYPITATGLQGGSSGDRSSNYSIPLANITNGTLTISSSVVNEVVTVTSTTTAIYGQSIPAITGTFNPALPNGITATFSSPATAGSAVGGSYPITVQFSGTGSGNYQYTFAGGSATAITIQQAAVNVTVNSASKTYGTANPNFTSTLTGTYGADATNGNITVTYSTTATQSSPVNGVTGYPISVSGLTLSGSASGNYTLGTFTPGTLTVNAATVTGSVNSVSKTYGNSNPNFTSALIGILPADSANVTINYSTTATQSSPVNGATGYPITITSLTGPAGGNYTLGAITAGTLTVNAISVTGSVNSISKTYGNSNPAFTSALTGILPADSANVTINYSTTATQSSPVNGATGYPITITGFTGPAAGNYSVGAISAGTLTIDAATVNVTANSTSRAYGATNPAFTGAFSNVLAQDQANVSANFSTTATAASPVSGSPYPITASALILTGSASGNYTLGAVTAGTLTINPASVTVLVNNTSKAYGAANPTFTSTLGGVLAADTANVTPVYSTTATQSSPVSGSPYSVTVTGLTLTASATGNYSLGTVTNGALTINPISVGVAVNSATRQYGLANPIFTGTLSNVLSQDAGSVAAVYSTTATLASPVAAYPITANSLSGPSAGNYTLGTVTNGTLTVTQAATATGLTTSAAGVAIGSPVTFTATVTSASSGTPSGSVVFSSGTTTLCNVPLSSGAAQCSTSSLPAGSLAIIATYGGSANFAASTSPTLTEVVATPGVTGTPTTSSLTVKGGSSTTVTLNFTAVNYTGTATFGCALLPADMTCSFNPASATFTSTNATAATVLTISTNGGSPASAQLSPATPIRTMPSSILPAAGLWLPGLFVGVFGLGKWRKQWMRRMMLLIVLFAGMAGMAAVSGCGGSSGAVQTPPGSYTIEVQITAGTVQLIPLTVVVQ